MTVLTADDIVPVREGFKKGWLSAYCLLLTVFFVCSTGTLASEFIPPAPDYNDPTMWITVDGDRAGKGADVFYVVSTWEEDWSRLTVTNGQWSRATSHYANVWNPTHREHMASEIHKAATYMSPGNRFYAPYYRHTTIEAFMTQNDDTVNRRARLAMDDVCKAFDHFIARRDPSRPLIIAGFSQGGLAVVNLLKHMSDATYRQLAAAYVLGYKVTPEDMQQTKHIKAAQRETHRQRSTLHDSHNSLHLLPLLYRPNTTSSSSQVTVAPNILPTRISSM